MTKLGMSAVMVVGTALSVWAAEQAAPAAAPAPQQAAPQPTPRPSRSR